MEAFSNKEPGNILEQALLSIPEDYRAVFILREIEQLSVLDTSKVLSISPVNVKVRQIRAKILLHEHLSKDYKKEMIFPFHPSRCDRIVNRVLGKLGID
ncbi:sigma-70-like protein [Chitinophaga dinghuensis]|uniref:Sigma-70-like protein n=1 Tax=Chitinophaga dinghuensis TaxID=1539050 RepID=A0A327VNW9_9BACT|nr:sigma factor-like helix-turn-helix DNA-binding protein [Chitinophaga dinghuensis]RAJ76793.1 sigma-70-like protein [Chitinophaga dinghuensis]